MKKIISTSLIFILLFTITSCGKETKRYEAQFLDVFDTVSSIVSYNDSKEDFSNHANLMHSDLEYYHNLYDIYNNYENMNNIKTINDNAGKQPVKVNKDIIDLIEISIEVYNLTDGKVNIAMGSVLSIWHDYREEGTYDPTNAKLPDLEELEEANKHTNINNIVVDNENSTIYLKDPEMSLNVGAIAKGYAVEQVAKKAINRGFKSGIISIGGNVRTIGKKESTGGWNIGIKNPDSSSEEKNLLVLDIKDMSLVTSGSYSRYYTVKGKEYSHIIDTDTLFPSEHFQSVSVLTPDSGLADALSTALFTMTYDSGLKLIESIDNAEAFWYLKDNSKIYSSGFEKYIYK